MSWPKGVKRAGYKKGDLKKRKRTFYPKVSKRVNKELYPELNEVFYSKSPSFPTFNRETKLDPSGLPSNEALMPDPRLREENSELRAEIRVLRSIIASAIKGRE